MAKIAKESLSMVFISMIAFGSGVYQAQIIGLVQAVLSLLVSLVSNGSAQTVGEAVTLIFSMDSGSVNVDGQQISLDNALWIIAQKNSNQIGIPDFSYMLASFCVWIATIAVSLLCILPMILSKIGITIMLAIGPIFIALAIWPQTRNYFASWLSALIGNIFTGMLIAAVCTVMPAIFISILSKSLSAAGTESFNPVTMGLGVLVVGVGLGFTALSLAQQGAQLAGGGLGLDSKGFAGELVRRLVSGSSTKDEKTQGASPPNNSIQTGSRAYAAGQRARQIVGNLQGRGSK
jgi:type IV secretion system protein VirB6